MKIGIQQNASFIATPYQPCIWRALIWHTGKDLPGHTSFYRNKIIIEDVIINAAVQNRVDTLFSLRTTNVLGYCNWIQVDNYLYIRFRRNGESASATDGALAPDWYFRVKMFSTNAFITDGDFKPGEHVGLLTHYKIHMKADIGDYSALKFTTFSFKIMKKTVKNAHQLYGKTVSLYHNDICMEKQFVEKVSADWDTVYINTKDIRAQCTNMVVNQVYNKNDYIAANGNTVLDTDTQKEYKKDAIGYCIGVPCDCLNGHQFELDSHQFDKNRRYYRAAYGKIAVEHVEHQVENGWKISNAYQTHTIQEIDVNGLVIHTTIISIPIFESHPPIAGTATPDLDTSPRKVRVTGTFHTERANSTTMQAMVQYLIEQYSSFLYTDTYFNVAEIASELAVFNGYRAGIYIDKPTKLFDVIGKLQNGHIYGWQFYQRRGRLTARVNNPSRTPYPYAITNYEVHNHKALKSEVSTNYYVSKAIMNYARNYSADNDDNNAVYYDEEDALYVVSFRGTPKEKIFDLLVDSEDAAKIRYTREIAYGLQAVIEIKGIELFGDKWMDIRQYDFVRVDIPDFYSGTAMITAAEIDIHTKITKVDIVSKV